MSSILARMFERRGLASEWTALDPVLGEGELGFEKDTGKFKMGDGISAWSALPHFTDEVALIALINAGDAATLASAHLADTFAVSTAEAFATSADVTVGNAAAAALASAVASATRNTQSGTAYTPVLGDSGKLVRLSNAAAVTVTIPENASVAFVTDAVLSLYSAGAGGVTIVGGAITGGGTVTIRNNSTALVQYQEVSLRKDATNEWVRIG